MNFAVSFFGSESGDLTSGEESPARLIQYFIGTGLTSQNVAFIIGVSERWSDRALAISPRKKLSQSLWTASGKIFDTTEITPSPPSASTWSAVASLPA